MLVLFFYIYLLIRRNIWLIMGVLQFQKDIYCIARPPGSTGDTYTLITPTSLVVDVCQSGDTTVIESLIPTETSTGRFIVDLNPEFYSSNITYLIKWMVRYEPAAPIKMLPDYFNLNPQRVGGCEFIVEVKCSNAKRVLKTFEIKRNDTLPSLVINLKTRGRLGEVIPFPLNEVDKIYFSMIDDCGYKKVLNSEAMVVDAECGIFEYCWKEGDTNEAGKFTGEFEIIFKSGEKLTVPTIGGIAINILKDINEV